MKKTGYWALACLLAVITVFSGCASNGGKEAAEGTVRVLFASAVVDSSVAEEYASKLAERSDAIQAVECNTISLGNQSDPTMYMAGTMKIAAMVAGKEIDVIFFDRDAAAADARAETFYAMDELFSADELAQMQDNISFMADFQPLNEKELEAVRRVQEIFRSRHLIPCTSCRYCTDGCPKHISIPDLFAVMKTKQLYHDWNADYYYNVVHTAPGRKASDCLKCGKCEKVCPQHLPIRKLLEDVAAEFEKA